MKSFRSTFALAGLFFAGLLVMWWLDYSGKLTDQQRRARLGSLLPGLLDTPEAAINRLELSRGAERRVFERSGRYQWQMREPLDVAADPSKLETLVRNLRE